jgi:sarcosine oxidase delta subunit
LPLISCPNCGKTSFSFARRAYVAHCGGCGKPLRGEQDTTAMELEIRERLYGQREDPARPAVPTRD